MNKFMALLLAATASGAAWTQLYTYNSTGSETIDGVTWQYCVSNGEARVVSSTTLGSRCSSDYGNAAAKWRSDFTGHATSSSSSSYSYHSYYYYNYYNSAISSSTTGAVAVPSKLGGCPVVAIDHYAFGYCTGLTQVTIPEGVREIGPGAFYHCTGLTTVNLPESLTKIDTWAFDNCTSLARLSTFE